jgi:hypothetical protein
VSVKSPISTSQPSIAIEYIVPAVTSKSRILPVPKPPQPSSLKPMFVSWSTAGPV